MAKKNYKKEELRILYKDAIVHTDRRTKVSEIKRILNLLTNREEYTDAEVIAFYWPTDSELDTIPMIDFSLFHGKRVVLPFITSDKAMEFKEITTVEFERIKKYGITQPSESHQTIARDEIDLFVIPAVAFNKKGHRIGSGKGYYDRYLEGLEDPICILLSLSGREHNFKSELHDISSNIIITEKRLIRIHESGYHLNDKDELIIPTLEADFDPIPMTDDFDEEDKVINKKKADELKTIADETKDNADEDKSKEEATEEATKDNDILDDLIGDENKKPLDEATKNAMSEETSLIKTMSAMGMTRKELSKKRKSEAKEIKQKLKEQKNEAKRIAKEVEEDGVEDELRKKLENDDKKKKNDLSDIPDADKLLAILESKDVKPKKSKKEKTKKEKVKKTKIKKEKKKKK